MLIAQSLSGVPTASNLRLMLCSMGERITHESEEAKSHSTPCCCTKTLKFFTLSLFCLFVTAHQVYALADFEKRQDVGVNRRTLKNLHTGKVYQKLWVGVIGEESTSLFTVTGTHPFVGCDITKMSSSLRSCRPRS